MSEMKALDVDKLFMKSNDSFVRKDLFKGMDEKEIISFTKDLLTFDYLSPSIRIGDFFVRAFEVENNLQNASYKEIFDAFSKNPIYSDKKYGYHNIHSTFSTETIALDALDCEARVIVNNIYSKSNFDNVVSDKEICRRVNLLLKCCSKEILEKFLINLLSPIYYCSSQEVRDEYIKNIESDVELRKKICENEIYPFLYAVRFLLDAHIDLKSLKMRDGYSVYDVYTIVSHLMIFNLEKEKFRK